MPDLGCVLTRESPRFTKEHAIEIAAQFYPIILGHVSDWVKNMLAVNGEPLEELPEGVLEEEEAGVEARAHHELRSGCEGAQ